MPKSWPISWLTTQAEMDEADSIDRDKLELGLENRTRCCYRVAPTDYMTAVCGHGQHKLQDPVTKEWYARCDMPCIVYAPDPALNYHSDCQQRRSYNEALSDARAAGSLREIQEQEQNDN